MRNTVTMQGSSLGEDDQRGMTDKLYVILQMYLMFHGDPCMGFSTSHTSKVLSSLLTQPLITVMKH